MKPIASFLIIIAVLYNLILVSPGCANIIPPTGGPRDSLPPVLLNATPADSTLNFRSKKITFTFNEYIQLENVFQNLIVSPNPAQNPNVEGRLREVTVTLRDTLEANTTYTLDFGNAIRDNNEGNPLKNFTYAFSTGDVLDSFRLTGTVRLAENNKVDSTMIVVLHENLNDSAVSKLRPRYVARVNGNGSFIFRNLPEGQFGLFAMKDDGGMKRYMSPAQLFAFADEPVNIPYQGEEIRLRAFIDSVPEPEPPTAPAQGDEKTPQARNLLYQTNLVNNSVQDLLQDLELTFSPTPLKTFDSSGVRLLDDFFKEVPGYTMQLDSNKTLLEIRNTWTENAGYNLLLNKDFAEDTLGKKLAKTDTISFKTRRENEYGAIRLRFMNLDTAGTQLLQFVQADKVVYSFPLDGRIYAAPRFSPGEYELRIVLDENNNGKWDAGKFSLRKQPERVIFIETKVSIKANWDNEIDITL